MAEVPFQFRWATMPQATPSKKLVRSLNASMRQLANDFEGRLQFSDSHPRTVAVAPTFSANPRFTAGITVSGTALAGLASDAMTGTNGTVLPSHTPTTGFTAWNASTTPAGQFEIQSNKAQVVATASYVPQTWALTAPVLTDNNFEYYADIVPAGIAAGPGLSFRYPSAGGGDVGNGDFVGCYIRAATVESSATITVQRWAGGAIAETFSVVSGLNLAALFTTGIRLGVGVAGAVVTVWTEPTGGGARTTHGTATLVTTYLDGAHRRFGIYRGSVGAGEVGTTWDNLTLNITGALIVSEGVAQLQGTLSVGGATNLDGALTVVGTTTLAAVAATTMANLLTLTGGGDNDLYLNGATSNWIRWGSLGTPYAPPSFTTRSVGTKLVLFPAISAVLTDYAVGIDAATMWFDVPNTASAFKWYGGTTLAATLSGLGVLTLVAALSATSLTSTIATGTAPLTVTSTTLVTNLNADLLDGQHGTYYAAASTAITGSLTTGTLPKASGATTLVDSLVSESGTTVSVAGLLAVTVASGYAATFVGGNVGVGTPDPISGFHLVDSLSGGQLIVATGVADATTKFGSIGTQHYTNAEEPLLFIGGYVDSSVAPVRIGGGFSEGNAATVLEFFTANNFNTATGTVRMTIDRFGNVNFGLNANPEQLVELEQTETITGAVTDGYAAALRLDPGYTAATALTVTRHNYVDVQDVSVAGAGPAAVTDAPLFRFDAAIATHKALAAAFTTSDSAAETTSWAGGIKVNVNGTLYKIPLIAA